MDLVSNIWQEIVYLCNKGTHDGFLNISGDENFYTGNRSYLVIYSFEHSSKTIFTINVSYTKCKVIAMNPCANYLRYIGTETYNHRFYIHTEEI